MNSPDRKRPAPRRTTKLTPEIELPEDHDGHVYLDTMSQKELADVLDDALAGVEIRLNETLACVNRMHPRLQIVAAGLRKTIADLDRARTLYERMR